MYGENRETFEAIHQRCTNNSNGLIAVETRLNETEKSGKNSMITSIISGVIAGGSFVAVLWKRM